MTRLSYLASAVLFIAGGGATLVGAAIGSGMTSGVGLAVIGIASLLAGVTKISTSLRATARRGGNMALGAGMTVAGIGLILNAMAVFGEMDTQMSPLVLAVYGVSACLVAVGYVVAERQFVSAGAAVLFGVGTLSIAAVMVLAQRHVLDMRATLPSWAPVASPSAARSCSRS